MRPQIPGIDGNTIPRRGTLQQKRSAGKPNDPAKESNEAMRLVRETGPAEPVADAGEDEAEGQEECGQRDAEDGREHVVQRGRVGCYVPADAQVRVERAQQDPDDGAHAAEKD